MKAIVFLLLFFCGYVGYFTIKNHAINLEKQLSSQLIQTVERYVSHRFGTNNLRVIATVSMEPTSNSVILEQLIPLKVNASVTSLSSNQSKQPYQPVITSQSINSGLPGMSDVFVDSVSATTNNFRLSEATNQQKKQQITEHIFYNKEVTTMTSLDRMHSVSIAVLLPQSIIASLHVESVSQDIQQLISPFNTTHVKVMIHPLLMDRWTVRVMRHMETLFTWADAHKMWLFSGIAGVLLFGCICWYRIFQMKLLLHKQPKTIVLDQHTPEKHAPSDPSPKQLEENPTIIAKKSAIVEFLLKESLNDK